MDHRVKFKEGEKRERYLDLARELDRLWNIYNSCPRYYHQRDCTETGGLGNKRTREDHPNNNIVEIS